MRRWLQIPLSPRKARRNIRRNFLWRNRLGFMSLAVCLQCPLFSYFLVSNLDVMATFSKLWNFHKENSNKYFTRSRGNACDGSYPIVHCTCLRFLESSPDYLLVYATVPIPSIRNATVRTKNRSPPGAKTKATIYLLCQRKVLRLSQ
jgi:hypothetical protein